MSRRLPALALALLGAGCGEAPDAMPASAASCPPGAVGVAPGEDLAARAAAAPQGTRFCLRAGLHRLQAVTPRDRQSFHGEPGAVLSGARPLHHFEREGGFWAAPGQDQRGRARPDVPCAAPEIRCAHPDAVFLDDEPLLHAASPEQLLPGRFFFDYARRRILLADDPRGRRVEASVSPYAFRGGARGVTIEGLTIERYATPVQSGAVGADIPSEGWLVRDNLIRQNAATGVVVGSGSRVLGNRLVGNGNMGAGCVGDGILFEGNEIARNGRFGGVNTLWEGGGAKCARTSGLVVRHNRLLHNHGIGFWTDIDNIGTLYEANLAVGNRNSGISHEISQAATIRGNLLLGNGDGFHVWLWGGAIQLQNARDAEVTGNLVATLRGNGIVLIQQERGAGARGPWRTAGNRVHGNVTLALLAEHGGVGAVADDAPEMLRAAGNRFDANLYLVPDPAEDRWIWIDGFRSWDAFRRESGQEAAGAVRRLPGWLGALLRHWLAPPP